MELYKTLSRESVVVDGVEVGELVNLVGVHIRKADAWRIRSTVRRGPFFPGTIVAASRGGAIKAARAIAPTLEIKSA